MRKRIVGFVICILLASCGGGSDPSSNGRIIGASSSASSGNSSSNSAAKVLSLGHGVGSGFITGQIALSTASLSAGGSATLSVTLVDQNGMPYLQSATVTFSSPCITLNKALITDGNGTAVSVITTSTGAANATYVARGCSGPDVITASAAANDQLLTAAGTITVQSATLGQVVFLSAAPSVIGLKGTGLQETSTLSFQVLDSTGGAVSGADVTFALIPSVGGVSLSTTTATSGADGKVQTVVKSGTVHTSVVVSATAAFNGVTQSTQSSNLAISTGIPTTDGFSMASVCPNVEAFDIDGVNDPIVVRLADRYSNPVGDGTAVTFKAEGGKVDGQCTTATTSTEGGVCSVNWTSQSPRPTNGRVTILATALGEESFNDGIVNGFYDSGEIFSDPGEPFEDDNESGAYTSGEFYLDFNGNGSYDASYGSFKGITCNGVSSSSTCTLQSIAISERVIIVMSTSAAAITQVGAQSPATSSNDGVVQISFNVKDLHGNAMPHGTAVTVTANTAAGTLEEPTTFAVPCDESTGGFTFTAFLTRPAAPASLVGAALTINVQSPSGLVTMLRAPIN